jgi:enamine deaminase RidA (YjgF/YER057c/UK114 family)
MAGRIEARLAELGLELPRPGRPAGTYVPYVVTGSLVFVSGQVPLALEGIAYRGKLGRDLSPEEGQAAARLCAVNLLAQLREACGGDLDRVRRCVKIGGFVNCTDDFQAHPAVLDGASDFLVEVFGEAGRHARFAVGAPSLPFDSAVEIDGIFEVAPESE